MRNVALLISGVIVAIASAQASFAFSSGITGYSGKSSQTCNACHAGGELPDVQFQGPTQVAPGATATFRFVLTTESSAQDEAGFNVAASAGSLRVIAGQRSRLSVGELTHSDPKSIEDDEASWEFDWIAPTAAGEQTLYGAGNAVNGNNNTLGDRARATTFIVQVIDGLPTATVTATQPPSPTRTPTATRTATRTATPAATATPTRSATASPTATATTVAPSATATRTPTTTEQPTLTATATAPASATPSSTETEVPASPTVTPTETEDPTATATEEETATPTATTASTPSATAPLSTASATPSATASATSTATATIVPACVGDCDRDQRVSVAELVTGVNIALDRASASVCTALDRDQDQRVTVAELVEAVSRALGGC